MSVGHVSGTTEKMTQRLKTNGFWHQVKFIKVTSIISTMTKGYTKSYSSSEE